MNLFNTNNNYWIVNILSMKELFDFKEILPVYMWDQALFKSKTQSIG
jgi:hypothetical protein